MGCWHVCGFLSLCTVLSFFVFTCILPSRGTGGGTNAGGLAGMAAMLGGLGQGGGGTLD